MVTATGNPDAVEASAREAGLDVIGHGRYLDHHWFSAAEARSELDAGRRAGVPVLLTAKDAVRWPDDSHGEVVMEIAWHWAWGGDEVERRVFGDAR